MYSTKIKENTIVKPGVGLIITDSQGKLLLERRRDNGMWGLPGGGIEPGESVSDTAIRETTEETGLNVRITGLLGVYSNPDDGRVVTYPDNGDVRQLLDIILIAEIVTGKLAVSSESLELAFFQPDSLPLNMVPPAKRPIQDYLDGKTALIH